MNEALKETAIKEFPLIKRGKVRDMYDLGEHYLMVATDRISAYDVVMPDSVPGKGAVLNQFSLFWFDVMKSLVPNHVISADINDYPSRLKPYESMLAGRSMVVKKCEPLPIECVVRGYITGSGWKSYVKDQSVCGIKLPTGLIESDQLPEPIFTPSTKEDGEGAHDMNISFEEAARLVGNEIAEKVRDLSIAIYKKGSEIAAEKGIIIADTKFEFGLLDGEIILIDEVLTPDSSRFWPKSNYTPGGGQKSFDKQYLRDYLTSIQWDKNPPAPTLPEEVVNRTREKYVEALKLVTGSSHGL